MNTVKEFVNRLTYSEHSEDYRDYRYFTTNKNRNIVFGNVISENENEVVLWVINGEYLLEYNKIKQHIKCIERFSKDIKNAFFATLIEITDEVFAVNE